MRSHLRILTLAFLLAFAGPSLRPARAGDVHPIVRISLMLTRSSDRAGQITLTADVADGYHIAAVGGSDASNSIAVTPPVPVVPGVRTEARPATDRGNPGGSHRSIRSR